MYPVGDPPRYSLFLFPIRYRIICQSRTLFDSLSWVAGSPDLRINWPFVYPPGNRVIP